MNWKFLAVCNLYLGPHIVMYLKQMLKYRQMVLNPKEKSTLTLAGMNIRRFARPTWRRVRNETQT
jgi:hypothetical protein